MRIAFVTPIEPAHPGIGTGHRAAFWRRTLASIGGVTTMVIPVLGDPPRDDAEPELGDRIVIDPFHLEHPSFPQLAAGAPEYLGASWSTELDEFDLIVGLRSYVGPFCIGLGAAHQPPTLIDLDDDDAAYFDGRGDHREADRFRNLIEYVRPRVTRLLSAQGFAGTTAVPNVIPVDALDAVPRAETAPRRTGSPRAVFVANVSYDANRDGVRWLLDEVWPHVTAQRPDAELTIAGFRSDDFEHGVGFVDDLDDLYASATVAVAPLLSGSGTRIKILEAWMHGVPVVATPIGIDGLGAVHDEHALITADPEMFANHIVRVVDDVALQQRLGAAGREHAAARFTPEVVEATVRLIVERATMVPVGPMRRDDVAVTEVADGLVVDDEAADVVHHLDPTASIVFALCDGTATTQQIVDQIAAALEMPATLAGELVNTALDQLVDAELIGLSKLSDRRVERAQ